MQKKEYATIKLPRRQGDCEVTEEVFESTASLLNKKVLSFIKQEKKQKKKKNEKRKKGGITTTQLKRVLRIYEKLFSDLLAA